MFKIEYDEMPEVSSHGIWAEKYRPKTVDDLVGNDPIKEHVNLWVKTGEIGNILLHGSSGVGKTSIAKVLLKNIPSDNLIINASDENSIETVRTKIHDFVNTVGINKWKIVLFDEGDRLSAEAQCTLRHMVEEKSSFARFIITCNYPDRIIPAIKSRFQVFEVKPISKADIMTHIVQILDNEKIKYELKDVAFIIQTYFPDIRKIINFTQQSSLSGELKFDFLDSSDGDYKSKILNLLKVASKENVFNDIRQIIADASFENYDQLYKFLYEHVNEYAGNKAALVILALADSMYQSALVFEKEITFVAAIHKIIEILK